MHALTVKSDFLRVAQIVKHAQFPLDLKGYLQLSFRLDIDKKDETGVNASIERLIDGKVVDAYRGFLAYGKRESIEFPDGSLGPKLLIEEDQQEIDQRTDQEAAEVSEPQSEDGSGNKDRYEHFAHVLDTLRNDHPKRGN